jgi:hypothetical protein
VTKVPVRLATRFEIKYRILPELAEEVRDWIGRYMEPDAFGEGGSARYDVHSLYLDSGDWRIYRETRNGNFSRFKLRARTYKFDNRTPVFLEVKGRHGEAMYKTRAEVSREEAIRILDGELPTNSAGGSGLENFRSHMDRYRAYPRVWVTYERSAWVGGDRGLVRVTFDSAIRVAPATRGMTEPEQWWTLPEVKGLVVLEVKYSGSYPAWVAETIRRFNLERRAMSKYRQGVDLLVSLGKVGVESGTFPLLGDLAK